MLRLIGAKVALLMHFGIVVSFAAAHVLEPSMQLKNAVGVNMAAFQERTLLMAGGAMFKVVCEVRTLVLAGGAAIKVACEVRTFVTAGGAVFKVACEVRTFVAAGGASHSMQTRQSFTQGKLNGLSHRPDLKGLKCCEPASGEWPTRWMPGV